MTLPKEESLGNKRKPMHEVCLLSTTVSLLSLIYSNPFFVLAPYFILDLYIPLENPSYAASKLHPHHRCGSATPPLPRSFSLPGSP